MANFSDLPLEVVRYILEYALMPPLDVFRRVLDLRRVNRLFDQEVMPLIGKLELLRHESVRCRTVRWHHPNDGAAVLLESGVLFLARYVLDRPHDRGPWWANISACFNHMADAVLGTLQPPDDAWSSRRRRLSVLTGYCRWMFHRPDERVRAVPRSRRMLDALPGNPPWFLRWIFPETGRVTNEKEYWALNIGWALFGPLQSEGLDGAVVNRAISGAVLDPTRPRLRLDSVVRMLVYAGNASLFRDLVPDLPGPFDANRPSHQYLRPAVCSGRLAMVRAVLDLTRGPPTKRYGPLFETCIAQAIRGRHPDIAWFLLGRRLPRPDGEKKKKSDRRPLLHHGLREACRAGYADMVAHVLETERGEESGGGGQGYGGRLECCRTPLEIACGVGGEEVVRLLLAAGADPRGRRTPHHQHHDEGDGPDDDMIGHHVLSTGSMFAAAVGGHVGVARILVDAGGLELSRAEWHLVARGAIECGQAAFLAWMLEHTALGFSSSDDGSGGGWVGGEQFDLLGEACVWGLGTAPLPPSSPPDPGSPPQPSCPPIDRDRSLWRSGSQPPGLRFESPLLAAMSWTRADVVAFLLSRGWAPIEDVMATSVGPLWREGRFPGRAVRDVVKSGRWAWETRGLPPSGGG